MNVCGIFKFNSVGKKTLRLMYTKGSSGSTQYISANNTGGLLGNNDIHFTVKPIISSQSAPILVGSVTSNDQANAYRIESFKLNGDGSCTVANESGDWVSGCTRTSTGQYTVNFNSGIFKSSPVCTVTGRENVTRISAFPTTSSFAFQSINAGGSFNDTEASIICMGIKGQ
jgi:hypothetical protein